MTTPSVQRPHDLGWLTTDFVRQTPGVAHAVVVSADGLTLAVSQGLPQDRAEQLAAVSSGLTSLAQGAAGFFDAGRVSQMVIEMEGGFLLLTSISEGACLAVLAAPNSDLAVVTYDMTLLVERVGDQMSPELRARLRSQPPPSSI